MNEKFKVILLQEAIDFLDSIDEKAREKIIYNINKVRFNQDKELFKKLKGDTWEFRTLFNKTHYRLFAFWDNMDRQKTIVITTHGVVKKTNKIDSTEIKKAETIKKLYFEKRSNKR